MLYELFRTFVWAINNFLGIGFFQCPTHISNLYHCPINSAQNILPKCLARNNSSLRPWAAFFCAHIFSRGTKKKWQIFYPINFKECIFPPPFQPIMSSSGREL